MLLHIKSKLSFPFVGRETENCDGFVLCNIFVCEIIFVDIAFVQFAVYPWLLLIYFSRGR
jgi:hypothetical protein